MEIRDFVTAYMQEKQLGHRPVPRIISKIESTEALVNFDEILQVYRLYAVVSSCGVLTGA